MSIFPTQHGFLFMAILIAMLLGSINYNNNAGFILVFLLGGMALISMVHSIRNLVGMDLIFLSPIPVFAGRSAVFPVRITAPGSGCRSVTFTLAEQEPVFVSVDRQMTLQMRMPAPKRGLLRPEFLTLSSRYPFGLFTFRATLPAQTGCLVYPHPLPGPFRSASGTFLPDGNQTTFRRGPDDFQGLKQYQPGHSINRISWKALSRGRGLFIKDFTAKDNPLVMLDFNALPGKDTEFKLSLLCHNILWADRQQMEYGLKLPGFVKNPARGKPHQHLCLKALALFDLLGKNPLHKDVP